jgi:hypothetical protein
MILARRRSSLFSDRKMESRFHDYFISNVVGGTSKLLIDKASSDQVIRCMKNIDGCIVGPQLLSTPLCLDRTVPIRKRGTRLPTRYTARCLASHTTISRLFCNSWILT